MEPEYLDVTSNSKEQIDTIGFQRVEKAIVDNFTTEKIRTGDAAMRISNVSDLYYLVSLSWSQIDMCQLLERERGKNFEWCLCSCLSYLRQERPGSFPRRWSVNSVVDGLSCSSKILIFSTLPFQRDRLPMHYLMYGITIFILTWRRQLKVNGSGIFVGRDGWPKERIEWKAATMNG